MLRRSVPAYGRRVTTRLLKVPCAAALRVFAQTSKANVKEETRLSGSGLEVSPGHTVSRERKIRHWRPMIVRYIAYTYVAYLLSQPAFTGYACHPTGCGELPRVFGSRIRRAGPR
jgi:hypothetical protein